LSPREAGLRQVHTEYRSRANRDGILWDLSTEEFLLLLTASCSYCGTGPARVVVPQSYRIAYYKGVLTEDDLFVSNGIDRQNPALGYIANNCVTACWECNKAKSDRDSQDFLAWIDRVYRHQQSKTRQ
jgi:5-methylcytosine-specific restriction endonuclease McrA